MKIAINIQFGGFSISKKALDYMNSLGCEKAEEILYEHKKETSEADLDSFSYNSFYDFNNDRTNHYLISAIESLGKEAFGSMSHLRVVEIPDDVDYEIYDYDGVESIHEKHRVWY